MGVNFSGLSNETMVLPTNGFHGGFWVTDKKGTNDNGGSASGGNAWRKRDLNTIEFSWGNIGSNTVSNNSVTPTAGWWLIQASAPACRVDNHILSIITSWSGVQIGTSARTDGSGYWVTNRAFVTARFYFDGSQSFGIYHKFEGSQSNSMGMGSGNATSEPNRFAEALCLKYEFDTAGATP